MTNKSIINSRLIDCETIIERGMTTFIEVGNALMEIRDSRLYRETHATFEDYCRERWGWNSSRSRQLISAAQVVAEIGSVTTVTVSNERQARELVAVEPERRAEVWQYAVESAPNGKVTAAHVARTAEPYIVETQKQTPPQRIAPLMSSNSDEWYTPPHICKLVRDVLGVIDLDPCSSETANATVNAARFFSRENDGLSQKWAGRVYMNPPYGDVVGNWVDKLIASFESHEVNEAIALLPCRTDTQWFQPLFDYRLCAIRGRLKFSNADSATFPSVAVYMGKRANKFSKVFGDTGAILERVN